MSEITRGAFYVRNCISFSKIQKKHSFNLDRDLRNVILDLALSSWHGLYIWLVLIIGELLMSVVSVTKKKLI